MYLVGDADRERGLARLRRHYADGRLSVAELDYRAGVLARARTTRELRIALRDLPYGRLESELLPRWVALRSSPAGEAVVRRISRLLVAAAVLAAWLSASLVLLAALGIAVIATGASTQAAAVVTLVWIAATWLAWRVLRARVRRI